MKVVLDESGFGMKVVLDENFWDEKRHFHPNLDESVPNPCYAVGWNQIWPGNWFGMLNEVLCEKRRVPFSTSTQQWLVGDTALHALWSKEFHRCLKIAVRSKERLTVPSMVVWYCVWLQLGLDCTLPSNQPRAPSLGMVRTTQRKNSDFKLNNIARCSELKTFNSVVQKNI